MTSKERAGFRARANGMETVLVIGKDGVTEGVAKSADDALTARELIKARVLETSPRNAAGCASELAAALNAEVIQVIGRRFVLYRHNPERHKDKPAAVTGKAKADIKAKIPRRKRGSRA